LKKEAVKSAETRRTFVEDAHSLLDRDQVHIHSKKDDRFKKLYDEWKAKESNRATNTPTPSSEQDTSQGTVPPSVAIPNAPTPSSEQDTSQSTVLPSVAIPNVPMPSSEQDTSQGTVLLSVAILQDVTSSGEIHRADSREGSATPSLTHEEQAVQRYVDSHPEEREALLEGAGPLPAELQEGMQLGKIQDNIDRANNQMIDNVTQALDRGELLSNIEGKSSNIRASAGLFLKESEAVKLLTQPHIAKLTEGIIHADAKADLVEAQRAKNQAEIDIARAQEELSSTDGLDPELVQRATKNFTDATQAKETAEEKIAAAQEKIANNAELSDKEFFQILARDDIENVIRELSLEGMLSLMRSVAERLPKADFANDGDRQKVANLLSSDTFWASLRTNMIVEASSGSGGVMPEGKMDEIQTTIEQERATFAAFIAEAQAK
jgi:hypothetical protein